MNQTEIPNVQILSQWGAGIAICFLIIACQPKDSIQSTYEETAEAIIEAALDDSSGFRRLEYFCDTFGPRFSGSPALEAAIDWTLETMETDGLENVHGEPVMVPHWVRGEESLMLLEPRRLDLPLLGLGGSIGTPEGGLTAEVLVVSDFAELERRKAEAAGKIVVFNAPFTSYGKTVSYRYRGAMTAGAVGAVASLIRSVGPLAMNIPHTGGMAYADTIKKIPHAAITIEAAEMLARMQSRGETVKLHLDMEAHTLPDVESRNVIAEWRGSEWPDEVVVMGGHIDSWDVGQGAMDDAGGCFAAWEAVRVLQELNLRPKRTIRVVLWTNEENGLQGGKTYYEKYKDEIEQHILAIESDGGVFAPEGFGFSGSEEALRKVTSIGKLLESIHASTVSKGGGGADISPLRKAGVPVMGLRVDGSKYFWYHHTAADWVDKLDPHEFNQCVAAMAVMAYTVADMTEPLPR